MHTSLSLPFFICLCPSPADESAAQTGLNFLFDVSSLPDADEVLGAELRVLRRESGARGPGSASPPLLLLSTCPSAASAPRLLHSRAAEFLDAARWEVFDVADALRRHRREPRTSRAFCLASGK